MFNLCEAQAEHVLRTFSFMALHSSAAVFIIVGGQSTIGDDSDVVDLDPSAAEWRRRRQPESSGAAAAEKQTARRRAS